jgi:phosphoribosylformylglycinamidine synthase subunit PurQ / glutaminase
MKALVLRSAGTNCDQESAHALRLAGGEPTVLHINQFLNGSQTLDDYKILVIPGGFSYGDDIAAGKILANELRFKLGDALSRFIQNGRRVIGICNGFQVLVKTGFLPGNATHAQSVTLAHNDSGRFQCHWVRMKREKSACGWLNRTEAAWDLPVAHGEGKFMARDAALLRQLEKNGQVVFRYSGTNPNGSQNAIAGLCNVEGNVIGLMPHPERHVNFEQHPEWTRRERSKLDPVGLQFFKAAVQNWN